MADIVKRIEELMDLFDEGEVTTANKIQRPSDPFREFEERNPQADGGRIKLQGGTDIKTRQGFQPGNPGNIKSLRELNISRKQGQDQRVVRFKELVRAGSIPNEAKKKVIEQFKLDRNPKAGTPTWMTKGKEQLIAEGFDYQASARGPKNVGGVEKAAQKRKQVIGEGRKFEERIKRTKQKTGLGRQYELAHTANIFQAKKLGIDYPIDALAIQTQDVNNKVAEALNDELKPLYRKQLKLVNKLKRKSTEGLKNQLDKVNNDLLEIVATGGKQGGKAANVLKPIIVNRDTLKGYIYTGAFDSFAELQASPGATTKATKAGSPDDLMARLNVGPTFRSNPFFDPSLMGKVISDLGKGVNVGLGPTGILALNSYLGVDPTQSLDRAGLGLEAALAKPLVKGAVSVTDQVKNPLLRKIAERTALAGMSPAMAMRVARIASPIGIASLGLEGLYQLGKLGYEDQKRFEALSPEEQAAERAEQERFAFDVTGA